MAVEQSPPSQALRRREAYSAGQSGQSILEFLLMLPMMIGLSVVMLRVNSAIQISIVNQQYSRAHALWLAFNSPVYPQLKLREGNLTGNNDNQMVIGVSDNVTPDDGSRFTPVASSGYIARRQGIRDQEGSSGSGSRANVRIRDTVTICTQVNVVKSASGYSPVLPLSPSFTAKGNFNLSEDPQQFEFCRSNLKYVVDAQDGES